MRWATTIKWVAILGVVLVLSLSLESCTGALSRIFGDPVETVRRTLRKISGEIPIDDPKRPLKKVSVEDEIRALGAICLVEAAGEVPAVREVVCRRAMETALRHRAKYGGNIDSIFRLAKTLYPRDRVEPSGWAERSVGFVFRPTLFGGYRKAQRVKALALAKELYEGPVPEGCATHYIRAPRTTTDWYDEKEGAEKLKATMYEVPEPDPLIKFRSYCPRESVPKQ